MQGYVLRLVTLDLILRILAARVMDVSLVAYVPGVHAHDTAAYPPGFGIPAHVIPDFEILVRTHFQKSPTTAFDTRSRNAMRHPIGEFAWLVKETRLANRGSRYKSAASIIRR